MISSLLFFCIHYELVDFVICKRNTAVLKVGEWDFVGCSDIVIKVCH